jgi:hypothetical protein
MLDNLCHNLLNQLKFMIKSYVLPSDSAIQCGVDFSYVAGLLALTSKQHIDGKYLSNCGEISSFISDTVCTDDFR